MALTRATDKIIANADGNLNLSGIVTATKFVGDGSQLSGVSGLGTALSNVSTNPLNKLYYVNSILSMIVLVQQLLIHHLLHLLFIQITQRLELKKVLI